MKLLFSGIHSERMDCGDGNDSNLDLVGVNVDEGIENENTQNMDEKNVNGNVNVVDVYDNNPMPFASEPADAKSEQAHRNTTSVSFPNHQMEQRLSNGFKMTINERKFIEQALISDLRVDGRRLFDYRRLTIKFGREDGSSEVQLGQTHVMGYVTAQLVQPYRDRPNEGTLSVFIEFSPMADPSFEAGRPGEFAVELGRIIDRGLRESRAVDTESLCVHAGKLVWSIRIDLHILDNGGNLVDAANVAAVAALLTFRRPECTIGGEDGQEVTVYPPEIKEPLPLIIHHLPIAVTFAFFGNGNIVVIDPTHNEEAVMGGRMTVTMNTNADVCAVQKAGGEGIMQSVVMQCLRVASVKAADVTVKIKNAVESYNAERSLRKIKRHSSLSAVDVDGLDTKMRDLGDQYGSKKEVGDLSQDDVKRLDNEADKSSRNQNNVLESETISSQQGDIKGRSDKTFMGGPARWDPYSKGISPDIISSCIASTELQMARAGDKEARSLEKPPIGSQSKQPETNLGALPMDTSDLGQENTSKKTLQDAVKPKNRRNKKMILTK